MVHRVSRAVFTLALLNVIIPLFPLLYLGNFREQHDTNSNAYP